MAKTAKRRSSPSPASSGDRQRSGGPGKGRSLTVPSRTPADLIRPKPLPKTGLPRVQIGEKPPAVPNSEREGYLFQPGASPNPGGVQRTTAQLAELARTYTFDAVRTVVDIMMDDASQAKDRLHAAEILLSRGYGRAPQTVLIGAEINHSHRLEEISNEQLDAMVANILAREAAREAALTSDASLTADDAPGAH